jgi:hypothetical protein
MRISCRGRLAVTEPRSPRTPVAMRPLARTSQPGRGVGRAPPRAADANMAPPPAAVQFGRTTSQGATLCRTAPARRRAVSSSLPRRQCRSRTAYRRPFRFSARRSRRPPAGDRSDRARARGAGLRRGARTYYGVWPAEDCLGEVVSDWITGGIRSDTGRGTSGPSAQRETWEWDAAGDVGAQPVPKPHTGPDVRGHDPALGSGRVRRPIDDPVRLDGRKTPGNAILAEGQRLSTGHHEWSSHCF